MFTTALMRRWAVLLSLSVFTFWVMPDGPFVRQMAAALGAAMAGVIYADKPWRPSQDT
jgi:hypothetical protein